MLAGTTVVCAVDLDARRVDFAVGGRAVHAFLGADCAWPAGSLLFPYFAFKASSYSAPATQLATLRLCGGDSASAAGQPYVEAVARSHDGWRSGFARHPCRVVLERMCYPVWRFAEPCPRVDVRYQSGAIAIGFQGAQVDGADAWIVQQERPERRRTSSRSSTARTRTCRASSCTRRLWARAPAARTLRLRKQLMGDDGERLPSRVARA